MINEATNYLHVVPKFTLLHLKLTKEQWAQFSVRGKIILRLMSLLLGKNVFTLVIQK